MSQPILVTGAAGGAQGSTGRQITALLLGEGIPVRAFVHTLDQGLTLSGHSGPKLCKAICWTRTRSALLS